MEITQLVALNSQGQQGYSSQLYITISFATFIDLRNN